MKIVHQPSITKPLEKSKVLNLTQETMIQFEGNETYKFFEPCLTVIEQNVVLSCWNLFCFLQQFIGRSLCRADIRGISEHLIVDTLCTSWLKKAVAFVFPSFKQIRFLSSGKMNDQRPMLKYLRIGVCVDSNCAAQISESKCKFGLPYRHVKFFFAFWQWHDGDVHRWDDPLAVISKNIIIRPILSMYDFNTSSSGL